MAALANKVALITGGGRGIGAATAKLFAREGAEVIIASRTGAEIEAIAATIQGDGGECLPIVTDVSSETEVARLFAWIAERKRGLDILVNNAGVIATGPFDQMPVATWDKVLAVNLRGAYLCARQAFAQMRDRPGAIINVSSLGGIRGTEKFAGYAAYTVSKHGVIGLTEALAVEAKPFGIRVNAIAPGAVDTAMLRQAAPHLKTQTTPEDIANVLLFLADPTRSTALNGAVIEVHSNA